MIKKVIILYDTADEQFLFVNNDTLPVRLATHKEIFDYFFDEFNTKVKEIANNTIELIKKYYI
jgi:hypothetical protein